MTLREIADSYNADLRANLARWREIKEEVDRLTRRTFIGVSIGAAALAAMGLKLPPPEVLADRERTWTFELSGFSNPGNCRVFSGMRITEVHDDVVTLSNGRDELTLGGEAAAYFLAHPE